MRYLTEPRAVRYIHVRFLSRYSLAARIGSARRFFSLKCNRRTIASEYDFSSPREGEELLCFYYNIVSTRQNANKIYEKSRLILPQNGLSSVPDRILTGYSSQKSVGKRRKRPFSCLPGKLRFTERRNQGWHNREHANSVLQKNRYPDQRTTKDTNKRGKGDQTEAQKITVDIIFISLMINVQ